MSKVKPILYMLGKGGISVLQTAIFYLKRWGFHIWQVCSLLQELSSGTINFDYVTLTVTFDLHLENFNFAHNFLTIRHRAFKFNMCVPYD